MSTITDPWATTTEEPAQQEPQGKPEVESKPAVVQHGSDGKVVTTFKEAAGFDASWIVIHADSVDETIDILSDREKMETLMNMVKGAALVFRGGAVSAGQQRGGGSKQGQPEGSKKPPAGTPPAPDDTYEYRTGSKNGNAWHAWMPPKGSNKEVVWLDKSLLK